MKTNLDYILMLIADKQDEDSKNELCKCCIDVLVEIGKFEDKNNIRDDIRLTHKIWSGILSLDDIGVYDATYENNCLTIHHYFFIENIEAYKKIEIPKYVFEDKNGLKRFYDVEEYAYQNKILSQINDKFTNIRNLIIDLKPSKRTSEIIDRKIEDIIETLKRGTQY